MKNGKYELIIAPKKYPGKKYRNKYAYEHIVRFWKANGFVPGQGMEIHHINGDHRDNRIKNLQLMTSQEHRNLHSEMRKIPDIEYKCDSCEKPHSMRPNLYRYKVKKGQLFFFCSQKCQAKKQWEFGGTLR